MDIDSQNTNSNILFKPDMDRLYNDMNNDEIHQNQNTNMNNNFNPLLNQSQIGMSILTRSSMMTFSKIICCICSATIEATAKGMCETCERSEVNITEGITKTGQLQYCKGCDRYMRPPWVHCGSSLESSEMMNLLLSKIKGLNKVKLIDSSFVWTEPHSKIIKLKLTVQKALNKSLVETSFVVEFKVEWTQCDDCKKTFTPHIWNASVQIRQKVSHKRTFMLLEQMVLKNRAHTKALNVKEHPEGIDFYFHTKSQALTLADFVRTALPSKVKQSKQLISHDARSNLFNYKYTFMIELAPVSKEDLIVLSKETSKEFGGIGPVLLCYKLSSKIHLVDPLTFNVHDFDSNTYWRTEFKSYVDRRCLEEFLIINVEEEVDYSKKYSGMKSGNHSSMDIDISESEKDSKINQSKSTQHNNRFNKNKINPNTSQYNKHSYYNHNYNQFKIATVQCIHNNKQSEEGEIKLITTRTHLGGKIRAGDIVMGYDVKSLNINEELQGVVNSGGENIPEIILVKKKFVRSENDKKRIWKLKHIEKDVDMNEKVGKKANIKEQQYEEFLRDIEEDKDMRKVVNLYKDDEVLKELEGKFNKLKVNDKGKDDSEIDIKVEELLEDLNLNDKDEDLLHEQKFGKKDSVDFIGDGGDDEEGDCDDEEAVDSFSKPINVDKNGKRKITGAGNKKQIGKRERGGKKIENSDD